LFKHADPEVYIKYTPNMKGVYISRADPSIRQQIRINNYGYRGPDWPVDADKKIVFLGDSFTAAFEVPYEKCFVSIVENTLRSKDPTVACLNFGVGGVGTGLELIYFEHDALRFQPDAAVLCVFVGNDFMDNSRELAWKKYYPYWSLDDNCFASVGR